MSESSRSRNSNGFVPLAPHHIKSLRTAILSPCLADCLSACSEITSAGVSLDDLIDRYIPAVARKLGDEWCEDSVTFASTTVGVARMQWLIRSLERNPPYTKMGLNVSDVLVLVPSGEQHTLGAVLLCSQLRRRGFHVDLMFDATAGSLELSKHKANTKAALISASAVSQMNELRALVTSSRRVMAKGASVVIGGTITSTNPDFKELSGADYVTNNVDDAVRLCALDYQSAS